MAHFTLVKHKYPILDYDVHLSVCLWNPTWSKAMHNMSAHHLSTTDGTYYGLNCFGHMTYILQTSMYQNIAKLLIHPSVYIYIYIYVYILFFKGWLVGWFLWHVKPCWLFNAKSCSYIHMINIYMICDHIVCR